MPTQSRNWTQMQRARFEASGAIDYVIEVVDGSETAPDKTRLDACFKLLNKLIPDLKAVEHTGEMDHTVTLTWKS